VAAGADVVVTKLAAVGALVTTRDHSVTIGPRPTQRVWPLGSGDAFAAGFTFAFSQDPGDPVGAAQVGSAVASAVCALGLPNVAASAFELSEALPELQVGSPKVYLAAPFFDLADRWLVELAVEALRGLGAEVFSPLHDVGIGGTEVAVADLAGLADCTSVLALLDGFDGGTIFETGWAAKAGIPVVGFCRRPLDDELKMLAGTGAEIHDDLSTALYRAVWSGAGIALG
jgi:hypothetical protein